MLSANQVQLQLWTNQREVSMLSANQVQLKIDSLRYSTFIIIGRITSHDHFWTYFSKFFELSSIRTMDCVLELRRQEKLWKISARKSSSINRRHRCLSRREKNGDDTEKFKSIMLMMWQRPWSCNRRERWTWTAHRTASILFSSSLKSGEKKEN